MKGSTNPSSTNKGLAATAHINGHHDSGTDLLGVPTICKALGLFFGLCKGTSPQNMAGNMVLTYLQFGILKFPLKSSTLIGASTINHRGSPIEPPHGGSASRLFSQQAIHLSLYWMIYPPINVNITMEIHHYHL